MIQNFGDPVNLYSCHNPYIIVFRRCLEKPWNRRSAGLATKRQLPDTVEFMISDHDFYTYGWEISATDLTTLHVLFEHQAKLFMRTTIAIDTSISGCQAKSIRRFQDFYQYPDHVWPYETIKKDLDRNIPSFKMDFQHEVYVAIQRIITDVLSKSGTFSKFNTKYHELNPKPVKQPRGNCQNLADPLPPDLFSSL
jgi:hypothetical protein